MYLIIGNCVTLFCICFQDQKNSLTKDVITSIVAIRNNTKHPKLIGWKQEISAENTAWTLYRLKLKKKTISFSD